MGVLLILLGIATAGVLADFLIENDVATAATQSFSLFGTTIELSVPALVAIAFGLGVLAVLLIFAGVRRSRRARRQLLQQRIEDLQDQNARLATKRNLEAVIRVPEIRNRSRDPAAARGRRRGGQASVHVVSREASDRGGIVGPWRS